MSNATLSKASVSDADCIAAVRALDMSEGQRLLLWQERWTNSTALQRECPEALKYVRLMELKAIGRIRATAAWL